MRARLLTDLIHPDAPGARRAGRLLLAATLSALTMLVAGQASALLRGVAFSAPASAGNPALTVQVALCLDEDTVRPLSFGFELIDATQGLLTAPNGTGTETWNLAGTVWVRDTVGRLGFASVVPSTTGNNEILKDGPVSATIGDSPPIWLATTFEPWLNPDPTILQGQDFSAIQTAACPNTDTDGDGLDDDWEINGLDGLDLAAMGADPEHKDLFLEVDYMVLPPRQCSATSANPGLRCQVDGDCGGVGTCVANPTPHSHKPDRAALEIIVAAFANATVPNPDGTTGINIHIDGGDTTVMNPVSGEQWGAMSESNELTHLDTLGSEGAIVLKDGVLVNCLNCYNWMDGDASVNHFDDFKNGVGATPGNFSDARRRVFRYAIFAHKLTSPSLYGIARATPFVDDFSASDFLVSLGGTDSSVGTVWQQAGTMMHELGHNLNLHHGGADDDHMKPNYLSIMNYAFATRGLRVNGMDGTFDYSRLQLPDLDEAGGLDEPVGLGAPAGLGTRYSCATALQAPAQAGAMQIVVANVDNLPVATYQNTANFNTGNLGLEIEGGERLAWSGRAGNQLTGVIGCVGINCRLGLNAGYAAGVAVRGQRLLDAATVIDWNCDGDATDPNASENVNLNLAAPDQILSVLPSYDDWANISYTGGAVGLLGPFTPLSSATEADDLDRESDEQNQTTHAVSATGPSEMEVPAGGTKTLVFDVTNEGSNADIYELTASSSAGWADLSGFPVSIGPLATGETESVSIVVSAPASASPGEQEETRLVATSTANPQLMDAATATTTALEAVLLQIDIKPDSAVNSINPGSGGVIPVAVLGSTSFDVLDVDPETLAFGPDGAPLAHWNGPHYSDVNDDGATDLLGHFRTQESGIAWGDTEACLTGETSDGTPVDACDDIRTVPACGVGAELALILPGLMWLHRRRRRLH